MFAGRISYGLYIYHILVAMLLPRWTPASLQFLITTPSLRLILFGIVTLALATLSWYALEQPINRFRTRKRQAALGPVPIQEENVITRRLPWGVAAKVRRATVLQFLF